MTASDPLGLTMSGSGTQVLTGSNTYSGPTTVNAGTLMAAAAGALSPNSDFTINGGTLDATGYAQTVQSLTVGALGALNLSIGNLLTSTRFGQPGRHAQSVRHASGRSAD